MRRRVFATLAVLALSSVLVAQSAAKPPSFAGWSAREVHHEDAVIRPVTTGCTTRFAHDDAKAGACVATGLFKAYPKLAAYWERGLAGITRGQKPACKNAIHVYERAGRKSFAAGTLYFKTHRHATSSQIQGDLSGEPYATLASVRDQARSMAIRSCH